MSPLLYLLRKTFINNLKELRKKPGLIVLYGVILVFFIMTIISTFRIHMPSTSIVSADLYESLATLLIIVILYMGMRKGLAEGGSFFRLSDVNLVFTSPISSKKVLVYGFIKQFFRTFLTLAFFYFQIPNLKMQFHIQGTGLLIVYLSIFTLLLSMELIGFFLYSLTSGSPKWRKWVRQALKSAVALFALTFLLEMFRYDSLMVAAQHMLTPAWIGNIPYLGWYRTILMSAVEGVHANTYLSMALLVILYVVMILVLYKSKTDYYEEVMEATEHKEQMLIAKKAGRSEVKFTLFKSRAVKNIRWSSGARAIFSRHLLEYRKSGFFFINSYTLFLAAVGVASKYVGFLSNMKLLLYASIYILFFMVLQGKWARELDKPYIYMIPSKSVSKLWYATLAENLKNALDGFVLFTVSGIMLHANPLQIVMSGITYVSFGTVFIYTDVLSRMLLGPTHSVQLQVFIKLFLMIFIIVPGIITATIVGSGSSLGSEAMYYLVLIGYNLLASFVILWTGKGIFEKLEMK